MEDILLAMKPGIVRNALVSNLSRYNLHICDTGTEALQILEALHPSVLIIELSLPHIDGLTVLRKASFKPHFILALTNLLTDAVLQAAADVGVKDIVLVPCTVRYIVERLDILTEKSTSPEL